VDVGDAISIDDSSTMMDSSSDSGTVDAGKGTGSDANVPDCLFANSGSMSMQTICDHSLGDNNDNYTCAGVPNAMVACCHCRCTKGINAGMPVSCEVGLPAGGSSCHPTMCMP
jgi:hypothetical protein